MPKKKLRRSYDFVEKPIGEGSYGVVFKARDIRRNVNVAVKKIRIEDENEGIPATALREIALLKEIVHPNVVKLLDVESEASKFYLIFEWVEEDLKKLIEKSRSSGGVPRYLIRYFMFQLLEGLDFCHSHTVFHRDLKPQNVLITNKGILKIADFGLARAFSIPLRSYTHEVVTLWYRAPEILLGMTRYSLPIDLWSVGCIFAELCQGTPLWEGDCEIDQIFQIFQSLGTPHEKHWRGVTRLPYYNPNFPQWPSRPISRFVDRADKLTVEGEDLLIKLLTYDPCNRITARVALEHDYFFEERISGSRDHPITLEDEENNKGGNSDDDDVEDNDDDEEQ